MESSLSIWLIVIVYSVGKTSLMNRFVSNKFSLKYKATIGVDFLQKDMNFDDKNVTLQIWDTCGQERFANLDSAFYRGANGAVIVFDVSNEKSFNALDAWIENFIENASPKNVNEFPFIIFGNKCDLSEDKWAVTKSDVKQWCTSQNFNHGKGLPFYMTSAKEDTNVENGFRKVGKSASAYAKEHKSDVQMKAVTLDEDEPGRRRKIGGKDCKCQLL